MNPWTALPHTAPFVLPEDAPAIAAFNAKAQPHHEIHPEIVPEPYLGDPNAPVVLLNLNPGFVVEDRIVHDLEPFHRAARENLLHERPRLYLLDPSLPDNPGRAWWRRKLSALIRELGEERVASSVFVAELHGYHSMRFHPHLQVPSQQYTFALVTAALARGAQMIVMRGRRHWLRAVPALGAAPLIHLRNPQNPAVSPGNCPEHFAAIVEAIRAAHR